MPLEETRMSETANTTPVVVDWDDPGLPAPGVIGGRIEDGEATEGTSKNGPFLKVALRVSVFERPDKGPVEETVWLSYPMFGRSIRKFKNLLGALGIEVRGAATLDDLQQIVSHLKGRTIFTHITHRGNFIEPGFVYGETYEDFVRNGSNGRTK